MGGLGIHPIKNVNIAILSKWLWMIGFEEEALLKSLLITKYRIGNNGWTLRLLLAGLLVCGGPFVLVWINLSKAFGLK